MGEGGGNVDMGCGMDLISVSTMLLFFTDP